MLAPWGRGIGALSIKIAIEISEEEY